MRTEFLCISVLRVASGPRVKLASCKSALNPAVVYSTDRSKAVVPVLVLLFVALWFILRGDLLNVFPCVILLCFSVLLVLPLLSLGKRELILVLFVRLFDLCLFGFFGFLFLLGSGKGCGLWLWHSLDFSLTFFFFRKLVGKSNFSEQVRKLINRYKRIGYSLDIMRQTACLVIDPIIVDGYASLFNCTTAFQASDSMTSGWGWTICL